MPPPVLRTQEASDLATELTFEKQRIRAVGLHKGTLSSDEAGDDPENCGAKAEWWPLPASCMWPALGLRQGRPGSAQKLRWEVTVSQLQAVRSPHKKPHFLVVFCFSVL